MHWTARKKVKHHQLRIKMFLTPKQKSNAIWNVHRKAGINFLSAESSSFTPFAVAGIVTVDVLSVFCADCVETFLLILQLMKSFDNMYLIDGAQKTVYRMNLF